MNRLSKTALRALGFTLFVLVFSAALHAQHGRSWVNGVVYGESDTQGLAGATVELTGDPNSPVVSSVKLSAKTDDGGKYYLQGVTAGEYTFRVSAPGFAPYQIPVYIATDSLTALHVKLRKEPAKGGQRTFLPSLRPEGPRETSRGPSGRSANPTALEQPSQVRSCRYIIGEAKFWPPSWHAWIGDDSGMCEIENSMTCECNHAHPEGPLEPSYRNGQEDSANPAIRALEHAWNYP